MKEENDKISKKDDQQNYLFFFEVKHSKKVSNREKMITKIRNLEKGKAEKSLIINNYWFSKYNFLSILIAIIMIRKSNVKKDSNESSKKPSMKKD